MRILFFIESLRSGGKERRLVELIKGLSAQPNVEIELVLTKEDIHYTDILKTRARIHYTKRRFLKKDPRVFYKFYKLAKELKPDIIHVWGNLVAVYAIPAKVFLKIPMFNNQISNAPDKVSNSILSHRLTFPFSNKIIANSYAGIEAYKAPEKKSSVIYNGFEFNRIANLTAKDHIRQQFNINTEYVVGMVASFAQNKDYETYIKAANKVLEQRDNVSFLCIGAGDMSKYKLMAAPENAEKILFLGKQANVESIMNLCDVGVLATYTEGISNALLEFAALGKPTITNFGGGNVELVKQGVTGFLINQKSPNELSDKLLFFLDNQKERLEFGSNARERIENEFSISKMVNMFMTLYNDSLARNK